MKSFQKLPFLPLSGENPGRGKSDDRVSFSLLSSFVMAAQESGEFECDLFALDSDDSSVFYGFVEGEVNERRRVFEEEREERARVLSDLECSGDESDQGDEMLELDWHGLELEEVPDRDSWVEGDRDEREFPFVGQGPCVSSFVRDTRKLSCTSPKLSFLELVVDGEDYEEWAAQNNIYAEQVFRVNGDTILCYRLLFEIKEFYRSHDIGNMANEVKLSLMVDRERLSHYSTKRIHRYKWNSPLPALPTVVFLASETTRTVNAVRSKPVLLVVSLAGIKVCDRKGQSVMMAHALRRVSYATCDPGTKQFAFLAREPKGQVNVQHCYAFLTTEPSQAEELNTIIGNVFAMAGEQQKEDGRSAADKFADEIGEQLEAQRRQFLQVQYRAHEAAEADVRRQSPNEGSSVPYGNNNNNNNATYAQSETKREMAVDCHDNRSDYISHLPAPSTLPALPSAASLTSFHPSQLPPTSTHHTIQNQTSSYMDLSSKSSSAGSSDRDSEIYALNSTAGGLAGLYYDDMSSAARTSRGSDGSYNAYGGELYSEQRGDYGVSRGGSAREAELAARLAGLSVENYMDPVSTYGSTTGQTYEEQSSSSTYGGLSKKESMRYRPLPVTPLSVNVVSSEAPQPTPRTSSGVPPRYQNDSPFIFNKRTSQLSLSSQAESPSSQIYTSRSRSLQDDMINSDEWYRPNLPREQALELLQGKDLGAFLIRDSATHPGCFALSVKVPKFDNPTGITHYLITRTKAGGVKMKGLDKEWPNLDALVVHHSIMPELLPCTLHLTKSSPRRTPAVRASAPPAGYAPPPPASSASGSSTAATRGMQRSKSVQSSNKPVTMRERPVYRRYCSSYTVEEVSNH